MFIINDRRTSFGHFMDLGFERTFSHFFFVSVQSPASQTWQHTTLLLIVLSLASRLTYVSTIRPSNEGLSLRCCCSSEPANGFSTSCFLWMFITAAFVSPTAELPCLSFSSPALPGNSYHTRNTEVAVTTHTGAASSTVLNVYPWAR